MIGQSRDNRLQQGLRKTQSMYPAIEVGDALKNCNRCRWIKNRVNWQERCSYVLRDGSKTSWLQPSSESEDFGLHCSLCRQYGKCPLSPYVAGTKGAVKRHGCKRSSASLVRLKSCQPLLPCATRFELLKSRVVVTPVWKAYCKAYVVCPQVTSSEPDRNGLCVLPGSCLRERTGPAACFEPNSVVKEGKRPEKN